MPQPPQRAGATPSPGPSPGPSSNHLPQPPQRAGVDLTLTCALALALFICRSLLSVQVWTSP
eukprot:scaffold92171_cov24-Phaeocystis_antarctica.AAC.1